MKRLIPIIILAIISILFFSCSRIQYVPVESVRVDSVSIRDTTVVEKLIPYKDSIVTTDTTSFLSNSYAYSRAKYIKGELHHTLGIWPRAEVEIHVPQYVDRYRYIVKTETVEVEKKLTRWEKFKLEAGGIAIGGTGILLIVFFVWLFKGVFKK